LKTEEELWNERERCSALDHKEAILDFVLVHHHKDMCSVLGSRVDSQECKLQVKDFKLLSDRFSSPTSNLLTLHRRHRRGTIMHKILVLWDRATVVVRVGTMLIGVQGSQQIRLHTRHKSEHQPQCQQQSIYSGKAEPSSCSCESCGSRRCSSSSEHYHWYDSHQ
jgi:hypothetical protein